MFAGALALASPGATGASPSGTKLRTIPNHLTAASLFHPYHLSRITRRGTGRSCFASKTLDFVLWRGPSGLHTVHGACLSNAVYFALYSHPGGMRTPARAGGRKRKAPASLQDANLFLLQTRGGMPPTTRPPTPGSSTGILTGCLLRRYVRQLYWRWLLQPDQLDQRPQIHAK